MERKRLSDKIIRLKKEFIEKNQLVWEVRKKSSTAIFTEISRLLEEEATTKGRDFITFIVACDDYKLNNQSYQDAFNDLYNEGIIVRDGSKTDNDLDKTFHITCW